MLNGGCVYFVYMIPLETDVLRKHRFQKIITSSARVGKIRFLTKGKSSDVRIGYARI